MINNQSSIEIFKEEAIKICCLDNGLSVSEHEGKTMISGDLTLPDEFGNQVDSYSIEIFCSPLFPYRFPLVFEVGGKLPRNIDWHVFETDGHCCIRAIPEEIVICHAGLSLSDFIEKELKPYFFNQTFRRINGYYLKERSHGKAPSSIEYFGDILMTKDINLIIKMLLAIAKRIELKSTSKCLCASNKKFKKCHRRSFRKLLKIDPNILNTLLIEIKQYLIFLNQRRNN